MLIYSRDVIGAETGNDRQGGIDKSHAIVVGKGQKMYCVAYPSEQLGITSTLRAGHGSPLDIMAYRCG